MDALGVITAVLIILSTPFLGFGFWGILLGLMIMLCTVSNNERYYDDDYD